MTCELGRAPVEIAASRPRTAKTAMREKGSAGAGGRVMLSRRFLNRRPDASDAANNPFLRMGFRKFFVFEI